MSALSPIATKERTLWDVSNVVTSGHVGSTVCRQFFPQERTRSAAKALHGSAVVGLVKSMKMMDRSMAVADLEAIGRRDRCAHPGLGMAHRRFQLLALGKTRRDR